MKGVLRRFATAGIVLLSVFAMTGGPAHALVRLTEENIDQVLLYGLERKGMGYTVLLGDNWVEGGNGVLLNIYTPFMMLASKAYGSDFSSQPDKAEMKKIREKFGKDIAYYRDRKNRPLVKFAVSFTGNSVDFATKYDARIEGFGRGKVFELKPKKQFRDQLADPVDVAGQTVYEAINSYYFPFNDLENIEEYKLILTSPDVAEPVVFNLRNSRIR